MLQDYGLTSEALEIVPDVLGWCRENGIEESNPFRTAKCFCHWADGTCHIVLVEKILRSRYPVRMTQWNATV